MGWWDYTNIGVSVTSEDRELKKAILTYIGYGPEPDYAPDGDDMVYEGQYSSHSMLYVCLYSANPRLRDACFADAFKEFDAYDLLCLMNALFPGTVVEEHHAEGNNTSDTYEKHEQTYDPKTMTYSVYESYTDYGGGDGPTGNRSWKERFALQPPTMEQVQALIDLSSGDENAALTALLLELSQKLRNGLIVCEDDPSDERRIGGRYTGSGGDVVIPDGVKKIGSNFEIDKKGCLTKYTGSGGNVVIPDGVTSIGDWAFEDCSSLAGITLPDGVTDIGGSAFKGCSSLTSITIPDSVISFGDSAFRWCSSLTNITLPDGVTSMGDRAFSGCSSLTSITIPDSVTSIGNEAFRGCSTLTGITIPDSVTSIGESAFYGCSSLTSITIPDGVTRIGESAFYGCSSLTGITIPDSVTSIGYWAFEDCSSLTSITIPASVTSIGEDAFDDCDELTIHTPAGSYAEQYARENGIPVENI